MFTLNFNNITDLSNSDEESPVVLPTKRKVKNNPNVQSTSRLSKHQKTENGNSSSDEDAATVSYKSKRSAMPDGPTDQGATAILVQYLYTVNVHNSMPVNFVGNRNGERQGRPGYF